MDVLKRFVKWYHNQKYNKGFIYIYLLYLASASLLFTSSSKVFGDKIAFSIAMLYAYIWFFLIIYAEKKAEVMN